MNQQGQITLEVLAMLDIDLAKQLVSCCCMNNSLASASYIGQIYIMIQ